jgi:formate C-acetyltransferase
MKMRTEAKEALARLRNKILDSDNKACFIEREELLRTHEADVLAQPPEERYRFEFELLMENLSTPIDSDDVFAGRMLEGRWPHEDGFSRNGLSSPGHITLAVERVLKIGLQGIAEETARHAVRIGTIEAMYFSRQTTGCVEAIRRYCLRYADAAEAMGKKEMARALRQVPYGPAYDMFSALQSVWMLQFICSTICAARDFAPGRLDVCLAPYCSGDHEKTTELFAFFMMKFNEITGTCTDNYLRKPVPCVASKQYITLGPEYNYVDELLVEAAAEVRLPQPILNFRVGTDYGLAAKAAHRLGPQCNFFNDKMITNKLLNSGIRPDDAVNYSFTACNRVDLPGRLYNIMARIDSFTDSCGWFYRAMTEAADVADVLPKLRDVAHAEIVNMMNARKSPYSKGLCYHFESLFIDSCVQSCLDIWRKGAENYRWLHLMFMGIGTMADSLMALEILSKRYKYGEIKEILKDDFNGHEELRQEIIRDFPKYGNGDESVDSKAATIGNLLIDAFEEAAREEGYLAMPSFYSLTLHRDYGLRIGATPNGRKAGTPISENQSPTYGADHHSPTALLQSVAALPLNRCICGGLNLKFGFKPSAETLEAMMKSYFAMGGQHLGFTMVSRETLEKARQHPEEYKTLLVRKTGFSEYFIALSPAEQQDMIDRTEY